MFLRKRLAINLTFLAIFFFAAPANACMMYQELPYTPEILSMFDQESKVEPDIDAAVWGVFLSPKENSSYQSKTLDFVVGGRFKGKVQDKIRVVTERRDSLVFSTIYHLNLKKLDGNWVEVTATEDSFNWHNEACNIDPNSTRCAIHELQQSENKKHCLDYIYKARRCYAPKELPKACKTAVEISQREQRVSAD